MYFVVTNANILLSKVSPGCLDFGKAFPTILIHENGSYTYTSDKCLYNSPPKTIKKRLNQFSVEDLARILDGKDVNFVPPQLLPEKIAELEREILAYCSDNLEWVVSMIGEHDYKAYEKFRPIFDMIKLAKAK